MRGRRHMPAKMKRDIGDQIVSAQDKLQEAINNQLKKFASTRVYVHNALKRPIYVLATFNVDWAFTDAFADVAEKVIKAATGSATLLDTTSVLSTIKSAKSLAGLIKSLRTFVQAGGRLVGGAREANTRAAVRAAREQAIQRFFEDLSKDKGIIKLEPGQSALVSDAALISPGRFLRPSQAAAFIQDVKSVSVYIIDSSFTRFASFNSHEDHSWVATHEGIRRQKYGAALDQVDPGGATHPWEGEFIGTVPKLAEAQGKVYAVPRDLKDALYMSTFEGDKVVKAIGRIHNWHSPSQPAIAACGDEVVLVHRGSDNKIYWATLEANGEFGHSKQADGVETVDAPALIAVGDTFYLAYRTAKGAIGLKIRGRGASRWGKTTQHGGYETQPPMLVSDGKFAFLMTYLAGAEKPTVVANRILPDGEEANYQTKSFAIPRLKSISAAGFEEHWFFSMLYEDGSIGWGRVWSQGGRIELKKLPAHSGAPPSLSVVCGKLHLLHAGEDGRIYEALWDGKAFSEFRPLILE